MTITLPSARSTALAHITTAQHIQSGNFVFVQTKFTHIKKLRKSSHIQSNERRLPVLGLFLFRRRNNETNTSYFIKSDPNRQDALALEYCAMYVCYNKLKCSDLFYIPMWTIYHLQQRRYRTNSAQSQKYSILTKSDTLFWTHLVFVLCNSYVLTQTEVYRSLLYIYWDNISTPTSVLSFVVRIPLRYSVSNKSSVASSVQI